MIKSSYKAKVELPYNPDDVNIRLQHFRVFDLIRMIDTERSIELWNEDDFRALPKAKETIDILEESDLQRNLGLWNNVQKSLFIESLMIKLPIPIIYLDGSSRPWSVIDGLQRLHTVLTFAQNTFKLKGLEYLVDECEGLFFSDLPGYLRSRIMDAQIEAYVINPGTPTEVKYNIFKRINTGGLKLTGQEIRNSFCKGFPADFTKTLAGKEAFKRVTNNKISSRRMEDREYATRFIAFQIFDYKDYISKMDVFLMESMLELYNREVERKELEKGFVITCDRIYNTFGEISLLRVNRDLSLGKRPNKALFDSLSWNFHNLTEKEFDKLRINRDRFRKKYLAFMATDEPLFKAISDTTSSKTAVINRFERLQFFIKDYLQ